MIVCKIELHSAISSDRGGIQQTVVIANVGGTAVRGNYNYEIWGKKNQVLNKGTITGFPRKDLLACDLLALVLQDARGKRIASRMK